MQLFLALILSCAALLVGVLAHADWKPYSAAEGNSVAISDDSWTGMALAGMESVRQFADIVPSSDNNPAELLASAPVRRGAESRTTERFPDGRREVASQQQERKLLSESTHLIARHDDRVLTLKDSTGRSVKLQIDFDGPSFEMLAEGLSKAKLAKVRKLLSTLNLQEIAERELRKEFARADREQRPERRQSPREAQSEIIHIERTEPVEAKREQGDFLRCECPEEIDRTSP